MMPPKAKFIEESYQIEEVNRMVSEFQEKGYTILRNVFERESVKEFKKQLEELMYFNGNAYTIPDNTPHYIHGALAPRGRQLLPHLLSHSEAKPMPSIHTTIIVIETDEARGYAPEWHKDRQPDGMPGKEYHYPDDVFLAFYFEDIDENHGPTQIIPGSHRDVNMKPNTDAPVESIILNMEDALLIDQRAWHRGVSRKAPGTRFVIVYGMYAMPQHYGSTFQMPRMQMHHWMNAKTTKDRVYFGGPFAPPTQETINAFQEEFDNCEFLHNISFPKLS
ncbi:MAG: phytanoyl-CoA dioxygenase family protein [Bacteroidales bacterium]|nr:phytanoyl-CoA dioxygenase family protein [Bacteroidales bacterium]